MQVLVPVSLGACVLLYHCGFKLRSVGEGQCVTLCTDGLTLSPQSSGVLAGVFMV